MRSYLAVALVLLAGCSTDLPQSSNPTVPPTFSVSPEIQWSGGLIAIRSNLFAETATLPEIKVAGVAVEVTRTDDSSVSVRLPVMPTQQAPVTVTVNRFSGYVAGTVSIRGLRTSSYPYDLVFPTNGRPVIVSTSSGPIAVAHTPTVTGTGLIEVNLRQGTQVIRPGLHNFRDDLGVGITGSAGSFVLVDSTGQMGVWSMFPPQLLQALPTPAGFPRFVVRPGADVQFTLYQHGGSISGGGRPARQIRIEDALKPLANAAADRLVLHTGSAYASVYQASTGDSLYSIRFPNGSVGSSTFSPDGALLYGANVPYGALNDTVAALHLWKASSADGSVMDSTETTVEPLVAGYVNDVVTNASGSTLFVTVESHQKLVVFVIDAATLSIVGRLESNSELRCSCQGYTGSVAAYLDEERATLFVLYAGLPANIFQFDVTPGALTGPLH